MWGVGGKHGSIWQQERRLCGYRVQGTLLAEGSFSATPAEHLRAPTASARLSDTEHGGSATSAPPRPDLVWRRTGLSDRAANSAAGEVGRGDVDGEEGEEAQARKFLMERTQDVRTDRE